MTDFGKRLKTLRKSVDITQEQLADALGISYQAVSKWETGSGLPDISLLPGIAEFFGVSTDWLLGIKTDNADEKINAVLEEVFHLKHIAKAKEGIALLEKALKAYHNNHKLLAEWAELKVQTFDQNCENEQWLESIEDKVNIVLRDSSDDYIRYKAKLALTFAYSFCGKRNKAEALANSFPDENYSRTEMLSMISPARERIKYKQKCICCDFEKLFVDILSIAKHYYCFADSKEAIPICKIALSIIRTVGNEGFLIGYAAEAYSDLANSYAKLKNKDGTIKNVKSAFDEWRRLDEISESGDYFYESPLLKGEVFNRNKITYSTPLSATQNYLQKLKQMRSYDWLKSDPEFAALLDELKTKSISFQPD